MLKKRQKGLGDEEEEVLHVVREERNILRTVLIKK